MKEWYRRFFHLDEYQKFSEEIDRENRNAVEMLSRTGIPLSFANFMVQLLAVHKPMNLMHSSWLLLYFVALLILEKTGSLKRVRNATLLMYVVEAPILFISVMMGTVWDPHHQASSFMLFMVAMPAFILDRPDRQMGVILGWGVLFTCLSRMVKTEELFLIDTLHIIEFFIASVAVCHVVQRIRLTSLSHLETARFHVEHDFQTGCLNRYALASQTQRFIGKPQVFLMTDMDRITLIRDFYGHEAVDLMQKTFAELLKEQFGKENTFRFGGDEFLCIMPGGSLKECSQRMGQIREKLGKYTYQGASIPLSCSAGYVTGTPDNSEKFRDMIRLADIYSHEVKQSGLNKDGASNFDEHILQRSIALSGTHAKDYEINRLTGLPVMSYFVKQADELLKNVADPARHPVIGCFKILHLRRYNNVFGYAQGDQLIADTAQLLREVFGGRHMGYITAGLFSILCYRDEVESAMEKISEKLSTLRSGYPVECQAGFAFYTGREKAISLMDNARIALKSIRDNHQKQICYFDEQMEEANSFRQYIVEHVDEAVEKGYLKVYYQPIVRSVTGCICDEEALVRWDDPKYGFLAPMRFIPFLEEASLMYKVNLNVVSQVLRDFRVRQENGMTLVPVSVNLSRKDFAQCDMVEQISRMVDESGFGRNFLKIEITESAFIANQDILRREISRFREAGFEVWMDDFGSEYSTLNLLQEMDVDLIKIDMKFMSHFSKTGKNYVIISSVIDMAKRMGITTLIEGVETQEQYLSMRALGCEKIQGYFFNCPNTLEYIMTRARNGNGLPFENQAMSAYYEAVGKVDFNSPTDGSLGLQGVNSLPSAIVEISPEDRIILRSTEFFPKALNVMGVNTEPRGELETLHITGELPDALDMAFKQCRAKEGWQVNQMQMSDSRRVVVYARRVSLCPLGDSVAVEVILMSRNWK